jgi:hypothetical protein
MSTLLYSALTTKRLAAQPGTSGNTGKPGIGTYVDAMAALVPAEVLTAHAVIVGYATTTSTNAHGQQSTVITDPGWLQASFYALIAISLIFYVSGRLASDQKFRRMDALRMLIPPVAFVLWTMLQKTTAFDAVAPSFSASGRSILAVLLAVAVGILANALGVNADATPSSPKSPANAAPPPGNAA